MKRRVLRLPDSAGAPILREYLEQALELPPSAIARLLENGAVYRKGRRCTDGHSRLHAGEIITVVLEEAGRRADQARSVTGQTVEPRVLFEDGALLAVDKPAGWVSQPTPGGTEDSVWAWAGRHLSAHGGSAEPGLVHRLDRETSGVLIFGKAKSATSRLAQAFKEGEAQKCYLAAVGRGVPERGRIDLPISPDPSRKGRYRATDRAQGLAALTLFERLGEAQDFALLKLYPKTGRTHQLRAHLTALGFPILGDTRYGGGRSAGVGAPDLGRCLLHAFALSLPHPHKEKRLTLVAPLPGDLGALFTLAGVPLPDAKLL
jgi:23S rRNA pseudouridine1911/1915/1917 synthase